MIDALRTEFALEARVTIGDALVVGSTPGGLRRVVPITGGSFEGPKLRGRVLPGGHDRQLFRMDGTLEVEASYTLEVEDGCLVVITNRGLWRGSPEVGARLMQGESVDPSEYYFRTRAELEAPAGSPHAWLSKSIFVGTAAPEKALVVVRLFAVL